MRTRSDSRRHPRLVLPPLAGALFGEPLDDGLLVKADVATKTEMRENVVQALPKIPWIRQIPPQTPALLGKGAFRGNGGLRSLPEADQSDRALGPRA